MEMHKSLTQTLPLNVICWYAATQTGLNISQQTSEQRSSATTAGQEDPIETRENKTHYTSTASLGYLLYY